MEEFWPYSAEYNPCTPSMYVERQEITICSLCESIGGWDTAVIYYLLQLAVTVGVNTNCTYVPSARFYFYKKIYVPYRKFTTVRVFLTDETI